MTFNHEKQTFHEAIGMTPEQLDKLVERSNNIASEVYMKHGGSMSLLAEKVEEFTEDELKILFVLTYNQLVKGNERIKVALDTLTGNLDTMVDMVMSAGIEKEVNSVEVVEETQES